MLPRSWPTHPLPTQRTHQQPQSNNLPPKVHPKDPPPSPSITSPGPEAMEYSPVFRSSNHSLSVPSPSGALIASVVSSRLLLRSTSSLKPIKIVPLAPSFAARVKFLRWSPYTRPSHNVAGKRRSGVDNSEEEGGGRVRVLLADTEGEVHVWDVYEDTFTAKIERGAGPGVEVANVDFGRCANEVLVWSEFQMRMVVWSLVSKTSTEIPNPKFALKGYAYRPYTGHLAILLKPSAHDLLSIHNHSSYRLSIPAAVSLPTVDAQGLSISPDGRWIAVWDSPAAGMKVLIYTADGHLYRTYAGPSSSGDDAAGLGVKTVTWSTNGDFLALGCCDGRVRLLGTRTFTPVVEMHHSTTINLPPYIKVWSEATCNYVPASQPYCPPSRSSAETPPSISCLAFSPTTSVATPSSEHDLGDLLATVSDELPTTCWVWSVKLLRPVAVLVHTSPIKRISWHPSSRSPVLLINCHHSDPSSEEVRFYLYSPSWQSGPRVCLLPADRRPSPVGPLDIKWIDTPPPLAPTSPALARVSYPSNASASSSEHSGTSSARSSRSSSASSLDDGPAGQAGETIMISGAEGFTLGYVAPDPAIVELKPPLTLRPANGVASPPMSPNSPRTAAGARKSKDELVHNGLDSGHPPLTHIQQRKLQHPYALNYSANHVSASSQSSSGSSTATAKAGGHARSGSTSTAAVAEKGVGALNINGSGENIPSIAVAATIADGKIMAAERKEEKEKKEGRNRLRKKVSQ